MVELGDAIQYVSDINIKDNSALTLRHRRVKERVDEFIDPLCSKLYPPMGEHRANERIEELARFLCPKYEVVQMQNPTS